MSWLWWFKARPGVNLAEVVIAAGVAATIMLALGGFISSTFLATSNDRDRTYAMQKALQMMEELSTYKSADPQDTIDKFADGYKFALTIDPDAPIHQALSGNPIMKPGTPPHYKFVRKIEIAAVTGDPHARRVTVRVFYAKPQTTPLPKDEAKPLAVVSNLLRSSAMGTGPKHVFDVYAISIENLPHVYTKNDDEHYFPSTRDARAQFEAAIADFQSKNSGVEFKIHYISRLSEGRDKQYRPYINKGKHLHDTTPADRDPLNKAYFYPGIIGEGTDNDPYYDPDGIDGKIAIGNALAVGQNSGSYALCDQFNHAVRYPEEFATTGLARVGTPRLPNGKDGNPVKQLSLRQFIDELTTGDVNKYRNAIVVNLHGELFPALPLRNYADPAKDPGDANGAKAKRRIVTHPYKLVTPIATERVRLLVHPFLEDGKKTPTAAAGNDRFIVDDWGDGDYSHRARVIVRGVRNYIDTLTEDTNTPAAIDANDIRIEVVQRERLNMGNSNTKYVRVAEWPESIATTGEAASRMPHSGPHATFHNATDCCTVGSHLSGQDPRFIDFYGDGTADDLIIDLTEVDYDARRTANGTTIYGIPDDGATPPQTDSDYLPHRMQYFPDPFLPFLDAANGGTMPRNTARVIIEFKLKTTGPNDASGKRFEVETQLQKAGNVWPSGTTDPAISRTYFYTDAVTSEWDATRELYWDTVDNKPTIPWTEQVQLVGDPRHNPYLDVRVRKLYNPYFNEFQYDDKMYFKDNLRNKLDTSTTCLDQLNPFVAVAEQPPKSDNLLAWDIKFPNSADSWEGTKYNMPAYLRMWRHAILRNNLVFVNPIGRPVRYYGLGGEFDLYKRVNDIGDLKVSKKPYNNVSTDHADASGDELSGSLTRFTCRTSDDWYCKPWLGELYPSDLYAQWNADGNLNSSSVRRDDIVSVTGYSYGLETNSAYNRKEIDDRVGLATLLNAEDSSGTGPIFVTDGGDKATHTATGKEIASALRQTLLGSMKADYGFKLTGTDSADYPPEWNLAPYNVTAPRERLLMDWLNGGESPTGNYSQNAGSGFFAVNPVLIKDGATAATSRKGIVVPVTMHPEKSADVLEIFKIGVTAAIGAYLDGTNSALSANHVRPVARTKIKLPLEGDSLPNSATMKWYARWTKAESTEFSPFYTFDTGSAPTLVHFIKYRLKNTNDWKARDGSAAEPGVPDASALEIASATYPTAIDYTWNNSALAAGEYELRVETYRKIGGVIQRAHHSCHTMTVNID